MDADAYALTNLIYAMTLNKDPKGLSVWPGFEPIPSPLPALLPSLISISILFRLWSRPNRSLSLEGLLQGNHPSPAARYHLIGNGFFTYFLRNSTLLPDAKIAPALYLSAWSAAVRACVQLQGIAEPSEYWTISQEDGGQEFGASRIYLNLLLKTWGRLRPSLEKKSLVEIAPVDSLAIAMQLPIDVEDFLPDLTALTAPAG